MEVWVSGGGVVELSSVVLATERELFSPHLGGGDTTRGERGALIAVSPETTHSQQCQTTIEELCSKLASVLDHVICYRSRDPLGHVICVRVW